MSTGYWLLDRPNPHGQHYYPGRRGSVLACVVHVTAGLQGAPTGVDSSAEQTALYASTTDRKVSWHSGSDRDSFLQLLPDTFTAWQCQGYNSRTIGHEISKRDVSWADEDPLWRRETLEMAAACLRPRLPALGIPLRHATRRELDDAIAHNGPPVGLIGHSELDPDRRTDPGRDFPWSRFLQLLKPTPLPPAPPSGPPLTVEDDMFITHQTGKHWLHTGGTKKRITSTRDEQVYLAAGVKVLPLSDLEIASFPEVRP